MKKKIETLFPVESSNDNNKKKIIIIVGLVVIIIILVIVLILSNKTSKKEDKKGNVNPPTTPIVENNDEYVEIATNDVSKTIRIENGMINVTLINNTSEIVVIDKLEIKENDKVLYETTEELIITTDKNTYVSTLYESDSKSTAIKVYLYQKVNKEEPEEQEEEEIITQKNCKKDNYQAEKYNIENYYVYYFEDGKVTNGSIVQKYTFNNISDYNSFSLDDISGISITSFEENSIDKTKTYYFSFLFTSPTEKGISVEDYKKIVEENGYKCE